MPAQATATGRALPSYGFGRLRERRNLVCQHLAPSLLQILAKGLVAASSGSEWVMAVLRDTWLNGTLLQAMC